MGSIKFLLVGLLLGLSLKGLTQINTIKFEHYTSSEGLSQSTVKCIQQDRLGFMWFGTVNGLNKFDGLNFTPYYHNPQDSTSLTANSITTLYEDSKGNLWVGTMDGLNLFIREKNHFQRFVHRADNLNSLAHNYIHDILEDVEGNLWIATRGGLCLYDIEANRFQNFRYDENNPTGIISNNVRCLYEDRDNNLWVGFFGLDGLQHFDKNTQQFTSVLFDKEEAKKSLLNVSIWDIFEDSKGHFWLGTNEYGLILFDRNSLDYTVYKKENFSKGGINNNTVWDIEEDNAGNLLLATEGGGLNVLNLNNFDKNTSQFAYYQIEPLNAYSINSNFLLSLYKDKAGLIWIGTNDNGTNKIDKGIQKFTHYQSNRIAGNNLTNKNVKSILQDHIGNIWVGTANGLNRIDPKREHIQYFYHSNAFGKLSANHITAIYQDKNQDIWIGTTEGLNLLPVHKIAQPVFTVFKRGQRKRALSNDQIYCMLEDKVGNFWIGTENGLNRMNRKKQLFEAYYHPKKEGSNVIRCMLEDNAQNLWLGTERGLVRFDYQEKTFDSFHHEVDNSKSLSNNVVHCLFEDPSHVLWVGTSGGLNKMRWFEGQYEFEVFNVITGLPDNTIYAIRGDEKGNLWLSTNNGLTRFNPITQEVKNFTYLDGLQENEFNSNASFKNREGELFFGGVDGLNIFLPEQLAQNERLPKVVLTDFKLNYKSVQNRPNSQLEQHISVADKVTLFPSDNNLSFEFAALNFTQSSKNSYAFKLEGVESTWNYVGKQNFAFYNNLEPGNYTFRVKAANNDGLWNEEGTSIEVIVEPTFYQTWYFKISLVLLLGGLTYLAAVSRVNQLKRRQVRLEEMVKERTEQVENKNRELESTVKTLKDTQAQLVISEKMASLGQLTAGIAHEINNPINFISSNVQALKMDFADVQNILKKVKELEKSNETSKITQELIKLCKQLDFSYLENEISELLAGIERGTERTVNIVSSLRTFSRNSNETFAKADIHEGLDSTLTILHSQFNGHIEVSKNYGNLPPIRCQISRLNQVFLNIINNSIQSIQAKANGSPYQGKIWISTKKYKKYILINIKDNGVGMNEKTRKRIFEPFYTTKDVGDGTGLGLSISYGIIEQHKGKIEVRSQEGKGAEFLIILPIGSE